MSKKALSIPPKLTYFMFFLIIIITIFVISPNAISQLGLDGRIVGGGWLTWVVFFLLFFGLGYTTLNLSLPKIRLKLDFIEQFFLYLGVGLGTFPILSVIFNHLHVPLHWSIFMAVALPYPIYSILKYKNIFSTCSTTSILIAGITFLHFLIYLKGAFAYPYLEDDDPWQHAAGVKYVALKKTYSLPKNLYVSHYLEPYPPTYDVLMGILHQTNDSVNWTLKAINALLVSLSIPFSYLFIQKFLRSRKLGGIAAFLLAVNPSFMSHFIWSQSLGIPLFFIAFFCIEHFQEKKEWFFPSVIVSSGILMSQPLCAFVFGIFFFLYMIVYSLFNRSMLKPLFLIGLVSLLLSFVYWIPAVLKYGWQLEKINKVGTTFASFNFKLLHYQNPPIVYGINEIARARYTNYIDQPIGMGYVYFALFTLSFLLSLLSLFRLLSSKSPKTTRRKKDMNREALFLSISLLWLLYSFFSLEANFFHSPFIIFPYRFWVYMAIPVAILTAWGIDKIVSYLERYGILAKLSFVVLVLLLIITSGYPKYYMQTSIWTPGANWAVPNPELVGLYVMGYAKLTQLLPPDTLIYPLCQGDRFVIGFDFLSLPWDEEVVNFRKNLTMHTSQELYTLLKKKNYKYLIIDVGCMHAFDNNATKFQSFVQEIVDSTTKFKVFINHPAVLVLEVI